MSTIKSIPILTLLLILVFGCGFTEDKNVAENLANDLFDSISVQDFDRTMHFYSSRFFEHTSQDEWLAILHNLNMKLGDLESYELVSWNIKKQAHTSGTGTYVLLQYNVNYSKYPSVETLTLFRPIGGELKILGHNINSAGLLIE